jgi:membrane associated rhomboid family serine protease
VLLGGGSAGTHAHHAPAPAIHAEHAAPPAGLHRHELSDRAPEAPMPSTVRAIRILMLLGILLMGLATVAAATGGAAVAGDSGVAAGVAGMMAVVFGIATVLSFALWFALGKASTAAWWIYVILAGLNVLAAPVRFVSIALKSKAAPEVVEAMGQAASSGAYQSGQWAGAIFGLIIAIVILYYWVQPDVKRWYGVN